LYYRAIVMKIICCINRHVDQWKRIEDPDINLYSYGHLTYDKEVRNTHTHTYTHTHTHTHTHHPNNLILKFGIDPNRIVKQESTNGSDTLKEAFNILTHQNNENQNYFEIPS